MSTTVATREQSSAAAGKKPVRADVQVEEEGEIVSWWCAVKVYDICDLGVHISSQLALCIYCCKGLPNVFTFAISILCQVFITYVIPIIEYNTAVWIPWIIYDFECCKRLFFSPGKHF